MFVRFANHEQDSTTTCDRFSFGLTHQAGKQKVYCHIGQPAATAGISVSVQRQPRCRERILLLKAQWISPPPGCHPVGRCWCLLHICSSLVIWQSQPARCNGKRLSDVPCGIGFKANAESAPTHNENSRHFGQTEQTEYQRRWFGHLSCGAVSDG